MRGPGKFFFRHAIVQILLWGSLITHAQQENLFDVPEEFSPRRFRLVVAGESFLYVSSMVGLYSLWYSDYPQSSFHFIDDNSEWLLMDKIGHLTTAASLGEFAYGLNRWTGLERKKAIWMGGGSALLYLTTIEVFDGFSKEWGASTGDIVGNTAGAAFFVAQQLAWDEQRFLLKFSFYPSKYAKYNPEKLGRNVLQNSLKDYNAQTYWLSANIRSFLGKESKFPGWFNVAIGYSGDGMLGAKSNPAMLNGKPLPYYERQRQYLLSLDVDLRRIKTRSELLKLVFHCLGFVKLPFPALEYTSGGSFRFHYLYY